MSDEDKALTTQESIPLREKLMVLAMLVCLLAVLAVPVAQSARNRQLSLELQGLDDELMGLLEDQRVLEERIAESRMPEQALAASDWGSIILEDLLFQNTKVVVVEDAP
jgi:hypothetical protein